MLWNAAETLNKIGSFWPIQTIHFPAQNLLGRKLLNVEEFGEIGYPVQIMPVGFLSSFESICILKLMALFLNFFPAFFLFFLNQLLEQLFLLLVCGHNKGKDKIIMQTNSIFFYKSIVILLNIPKRIWLSLKKAYPTQLWWIRERQTQVHRLFHMSSISNFK